MIKEEEYLKARQIVQEYEKQLNISDVIKSVCENNEHIWTYNGTDKEKMQILNKCVKCGLEIPLSLPNPF
jgi:hypothetical protein